MSIYRIALLLSVCALAVTACAHKSRISSPDEPPQERVIAPAINPTTAEGMVALGKRLTLYRRAVYSLSRDQYTYFAGGDLNAVYDASTQVLKISSLGPNNRNLECVYSPQGVLFIDPSSSDRKAFQAACIRLAEHLSDHLTP